VSKSIILLVPIRTVSEANMTGEHWTKKHRRHKLQKQAVKDEFIKISEKINTPCEVNLTRIAPRNLDYDNLCSSQKTIFDALCDCIIPGLKAGRADGEGKIKAHYFQEKGRPKEYAVKIEIIFSLQ